jgi:2-dehydro-3-deoxyphosphogluconate aldolase/(4S)-4-hydroxy-2-oxoglutarate aldolase
MHMAVTLTAAQVVRDAPVIPVIVLSEIAHAVPLANALVRGGIRMLEVTLRTPQALGCIEAIAAHVPDAVPGAGTVRTAQDVHAAVRAGAKFIVSPGYAPAIGEACRELDVPLLPGVATSSEIMAACADGFTELKFFPAMASGGVALLDAWRGPFPDVTFCPTGGITPENALHVLSLSNVACVGGSWLAPKAALEREDWDAIARLAATCSAWPRGCA